MIRQHLFQPCIPTRAIKVPTGPDWLHEVKHDGYWLIVQRDGDRVRLFTRSGYDWTARYPWIVEAALKNRQKHFVDRRRGRGARESTADPTSTRCIPASTTKRFSFTPSTCWPVTATTCGLCRYQCARQTFSGF